MKLSIYSSAFDLIQNNIKWWEKSLVTSCQFADEVVVAVNESSDDTADRIRALGFDNLAVIPCSFSRDDPWYDGKLKNEALQATTGDIKIQIDLDEYIPLWQRPLWESYGNKLLRDESAGCFAVASVNLYKDWGHYYSITHKTYLHKGGCFRSPAKQFRNSDGTIDTMFSDGCDLTFEDGTPVPAVGTPIEPSVLARRQAPFVVHYGYVDLGSRIERNEKFWKEHWYTESGGKAPRHKIHMKEEDFDMDYIPHNFNL